MVAAAEGPVLLVATDRRTNLTLGQLAPLFAVLKPGADWIVDHTAPLLALLALALALALATWAASL